MHNITSGAHLFLIFHFTVKRVSKEEFNVMILQPES